MKDNKNGHKERAGDEERKLELSREMLKQVLGLSDVDAEAVIAYAVARMDHSGERVEGLVLEDWGSGLTWVTCYGNKLFSIYDRYRLIRGELK